MCAGAPSVDSQDRACGIGVSYSDVRLIGAVRGAQHDSRAWTELAFDAPQVDSGHSAPAPGASMCQCICGVTPGAAAFARM
jgi:hypothetical protein